MNNKVLTTALAFGLAASAAFAEEEKAGGPTFKVSGEVEFDAYADWVPDADDDRLSHSFASTFDLLFEVQFNDKWSAEAAISADDDGYDPGFAYDGAFIQYTRSDDFVIRGGDLTFSEGAFRYYGYDDPGDDAIGMTEQDIRGIEAEIKGVYVGLGFTRGDCDEEDEEGTCIAGDGAYAYNVHLAYDLGIAEHNIRPWVDYKSYQEEDHNQLRAGVTAELVFGEAFSIQLAYGLYYNYLASDEDEVSVMNHAFAVEPEASFGPVFVKAAFYYAILDDDADDFDNPDMNSNPEYMFGYVEPGYTFNDLLAVGLPIEYHTNTLDSDEEVATFDVGPRVYFTPVEGLEVTGFIMADIPLGDDIEGDDDNVGVQFGVETVFAF